MKAVIPESCLLIASLIVLLLWLEKMLQWLAMYVKLSCSVNRNPGAQIPSICSVSPTECSSQLSEYIFPLPRVIHSSRWYIECNVCLWEKGLWYATPTQPSLIESNQHHLTVILGVPVVATGLGVGKLSAPIFCVSSAYPIDTWLDCQRESGQSISLQSAVSSWRVQSWRVQACLSACEHIESLVWIEWRETCLHHY